MWPGLSARPHPSAITLCCCEEEGEEGEVGPGTCEGGEEGAL